MQIIAEVKTHSPFGWQSPKGWMELFNIANEVGDIVSVHTDPRWHGSLELISKARQLTKKPILAKGIHATDSEISDAVHAGADFVLVVGRTASIHLDKCLIEPNSLAELATLDTQQKVVWNSRDLATGELKLETFQEAREIFPGWLCQASNVHFLSDVNPAADAILIGEHLPSLYEEIKNKQ